MATSEPTASGADADPNTANLRPSSTSKSGLLHSLRRSLPLLLRAFHWVRNEPHPSHLAMARPKGPNVQLGGTTLRS